MSVPKYEIETTLNIYDNTAGNIVATVKEDSDGLGLVEVKTSKGISNSHSMTMEPQLAKLLAEAILRVADEIIAKNPEEHKQ